MVGKAAVCHVSTNQVITQPGAHRLLAVPKATDLQSALRAINMLQQNFQIMAGQANNQKNNNPSQPGGSSSRQPPKTGRWVEESRDTSTERIYNKDDKEQYVDVKRINSLDMRDTVTGEVWHWQLK